MKSKTFVRVVAILLAIILIVSILVGVLGSVYAGAIASQEALDALKEQETELSQKKQEVQSQINSLEYEHMNILSKKEVLDEQVELTQQEIVNITEQIDAYIVVIDYKELEVIAAQEAENRQLAEYKAHIRAMEEAGAMSYVGVVFEASSFSDLLGRLDFVKQIMNEDERQYRKFIAAKEATQAAIAALEDAIEEQKAEKVLLQDKEIELQEKVAEAQVLLIELESNIDTYEALYAEVEASRAELEKQIDEMNKEIERQKQADLLKGTGSFIWPAPASTIVTSRFGTRLHPVYQTYRTHYGVDIGASYGTNVLASDSGTVTTSTYSSSYGNYVAINHGNGYSTLYAHMSKLYVSSGEEVSQGDVIGLIGSTGVSTGAHLHFEIRQNGSCINPLDFFSGYTIQE